MQSGLEQKQMQIHTIPGQYNIKSGPLEILIASLPLGDGVKVERNLSDYLLLAIALHIQKNRKLYLHIDLTVRQLGILLKNMQQPDIVLVPCLHSSINERDYPQYLPNLKYLVTTMRKDATLYLHELTLNQITVCMEKLKLGAHVVLRCPPHSHPKREVFLVQARYMISHMPEYGIFEFTDDTSLLDIKEILPLTSKGAVFNCRARQASRELMELIPKDVNVMLSGITIDAAISLLTFIPYDVKLATKNWSPADVEKLTVAWAARVAAMEVAMPVVTLVPKDSLQPQMRITREKRKAKVLDEPTKTHEEKKETNVATYKKPHVNSGRFDRLSKLRDPFIEAIVAKSSDVEQKYAEFMEKAKLQSAPALTISAMLCYQSEKYGYKFIVILAIENGFLDLAERMIDDLIQRDVKSAVKVYRKIISCIASDLNDRRVKVCRMSVETGKALNNLLKKILSAELLVSSPNVEASSRFSSKPGTDDSQMSSPRSTVETSSSSLSSSSSSPTALQEHSLFGSGGLSLATDDDELTSDDPIAPGMQAENQFSTQTPVDSYSMDDGMIDLRDESDEPSLLDDPFEKFGLTRR